MLRLSWKVGLLLHGQNSKQRLVDGATCAGKNWNWISRAATERGKAAQRRFKSVCGYTNKNQNSNWQMCLRGFGKAMNSVS